MPREYPSLVGCRFERLWVVKRLPNRIQPNGQPRRMWLCLCDCGNARAVPTAPLINGNTKSCGCRRRDTMKTMSGPMCPTWKGGRHEQEGYVLLRATHHPRAKAKNGYVWEHVLVMEQTLGRHLLPGETVHHKNGIRDDNRPENLELWAKSHSPGQRVSDLVAWAKQILERYGDV